MSIQSRPTKQDLTRALTSKVVDDSVRLSSRRGAMDLLSCLFRKDEEINADVTRTALELLVHPDLEVETKAFG